MIPPRQLPHPGTVEARDQGCTYAEHAPDADMPVDANCPLHGRAAQARNRAGEAGQIDTEGDIVDAASEPELRRNR